MARPFVFCHMEISIDGKIMGKYMMTPEETASNDIYYRIAFGKHPFYKHQGWLSGRITTDDNFTMYKKPALDENAPAVPEGDYDADTDFGMYYVSIDPHGRLGWTTNTLQYNDTKARVLEVLTEEASNSYKAFLRKLRIPYIIAGKHSLDEEALLEKLGGTYHIRMLMLGGGGILNWSFIQKGLCDEVSLVVIPAADASAETQSVFTAKEGFSTDDPVGFDLIDVKKEDGGTLWVRYGVKNRK